MEGKKKKKNWNFGEVDLENRDGGFCILSFSLLFLVAKFSNPFLVWSFVSRETIVI